MSAMTIKLDDTRWTIDLVSGLVESKRFMIKKVDINVREKKEKVA